MAVIKGKVLSAYVTEKGYRREDADSMYKDRWTITISLEGKNLEKAKALKLNIKEGNEFSDGLPHVEMKRNLVTKKGEKQSSPELFDKNNEVFPQETLIGRGSEAVVGFFTYSIPGKSFQGAYLEKVRITDLVEVEREADEDAEFWSEDAPKPAKKAKKVEAEDTTDVDEDEEFLED